jgi:hypothetical protein
MVAEKPPIASEINTQVESMAEQEKRHQIWYHMVQHHNPYLEVNRTDTFIFSCGSIISFAQIIFIFFGLYHPENVKRYFQKYLIISAKLAMLT